jgi:DNA-binding transcriptional MerR regulator
MEPSNIFADSSGRMALTRYEVAWALGISASQIDKLTKRGLLRPSRATRRPLYSLREIERFLRDTTVQLEDEGDGVCGA